MAVSRQINNLIIKHSGIFEKHQVITPDKRVIEEFDRWEDAVGFCQRTKDFISSSPPLSPSIKWAGE